MITSFVWTFVWTYVCGDGVMEVTRSYHVPCCAACLAAGPLVAGRAELQHIYCYCWLLLTNIAATARATARQPPQPLSRPGLAARGLRWLCIGRGSL